MSLSPWFQQLVWFLSSFLWPSTPFLLTASSPFCICFYSIEGLWSRLPLLMICRLPIWSTSSTPWTCSSFSYLFLGTPETSLASENWCTWFSKVAYWCCAGPTCTGSSFLMLYWILGSTFQSCFLMLYWTYLWMEGGMDNFASLQNKWLATSKVIMSATSHFPCRTC